MKYKSCDVEAWSPRQKKYFEVGSCSNLTDAQARRLSIRYKDEDGKTKLALVADFDRVLGIGLIEARERALAEKKQEQAEETPDVSPELLAYINERIEARRAAKKAKNFAEADRIRDELAAEGIILVDTAAGTTWKKAE